MLMFQKKENKSKQKNQKTVKSTSTNHRTLVQYESIISHIP